MSFRTVVFLAADHVTNAAGTRRRIACAPRCFVQVRADLFWDGEIEVCRNFGFDVVRLAGRCPDTTRRRLEQYAARFTACELPLLITVGGQRTVIPVLRSMAVVYDVPFPQVAHLPDRVGGPPREAVAVHFDIAEYLRAGCRTPGAVLTDLLEACGLSAEVVRGLGRSSLIGAFLRAIATCLVYLRISYVAGRMTRDARVRAEDDLLELVVRHVRNHGVAATLCERFRAERSFVDYDA